MASFLEKAGVYQREVARKKRGADGVDIRPVAQDRVDCVEAVGGQVGRRAKRKDLVDGQREDGPRGQVGESC